MGNCNIQIFKIFLDFTDFTVYGTARPRERREINKKITRKEGRKEGEKIFF